MNSRVASYGALVCAWAVSSGDSVAYAQTATGRPTKQEAIAHLTQGNAHYKVRDFEEAVTEYKAGALIEAAAIFDYNLGQCYRQLAKYPDAIWHYERYLRSGVATQPETASINKWITEMRAEMEQHAKSTPPTEPAAMQPQPQLQPQPSVARERVQPWSHDAFGWGLVGAGVALAGVGTALLIDAASLRSDANGVPSQEQQNALHDKADSRALGGTILAIGGGALVVAGIIKLAVRDRDNSPSTTVSDWNLGVSARGMFVFGHF